MSWNSTVSYVIGVEPSVAATASSRSSGTGTIATFGLIVVNG